MSEGLTIDERVQAIMLDLEPVKKSERSGEGYSYRGIDQIINALSPLLAKHGVSIRAVGVDVANEWVTTTTKRGERTERLTDVVYTYEVRGLAGDSFQMVVAAAAMNARDKSAVSAGSYAYRTAVSMLFAIPTAAPDVEVDDTPVARPGRFVDGETRDGFLRTLKAEKTALPGEVFEALRASLTEVGALLDTGHVPDPMPVEVWQAASKVLTAQAIGGRLGEFNQPEPEPVPDPPVDDSVRAEPWTRARLIADMPDGWEYDTLLEAMLVKANLIRPDGNGGAGFESWGDLKPEKGLVSELMAQAKAGTLGDTKQEAFL